LQLYDNAGNLVNIQQVTSQIFNQTVPEQTVPISDNVSLYTDANGQTWLQLYDNVGNLINRQQVNL